MGGNPKIRETPQNGMGENHGNIRLKWMTWGEENPLFSENIHMAELIKWMNLGGNLFHPYFWWSYGSLLVALLAHLLGFLRHKIHQHVCLEWKAGTQKKHMILSSWWFQMVSTPLNNMIVKLDHFPK